MLSKTVKLPFEKPSSVIIRIAASRFINARDVAALNIVNNAGQTAVPTAVPQRTPPLAKYMPDNP